MQVETGLTKARSPGLVKLGQTRTLLGELTSPIENGSPTPSQNLPRQRGKRERHDTGLFVLCMQYAVSVF